MAAGGAVDGEVGATHTLRSWRFFCVACGAAVGLLIEAGFGRAWDWFREFGGFRLRLKVVGVAGWVKVGVGLACCNSLRAR